MAAQVKISNKVVSTSILSAGARKLPKIAKEHGTFRHHCKFPYMEAYKNLCVTLVIMTVKPELSYSFTLLVGKMKTVI